MVCFGTEQNADAGVDAVGIGAEKRGVRQGDESKGKAFFLFAGETQSWIESQGRRETATRKKCERKKNQRYGPRGGRRRQERRMGGEDEDEPTKKKQKKKKMKEDVDEDTSRRQKEGRRRRRKRRERENRQGGER